MSDNIKHPKHYTQGIECWDYVHSHKMGFLDGNVIKYVTRYRHKNGIEDLKKARTYLEKLIAVTENPEHRGDSLSVVTVNGRFECRLTRDWTVNDALGFVSHFQGQSIIMTVEVLA